MPALHDASGRVIGAMDSMPLFINARDYTVNRLAGAPDTPVDADINFEPDAPAPPLSSIIPGWDRLR
jgi:hypothetical protein